VDCVWINEWMGRLFGLMDGWEDLKRFEGIGYESLGLI